MRNFRNRERDKLPVLYVRPVTVYRPSPYEGRLMYQRMLLEAENASLREQLRESREYCVRLQFQILGLERDIQILR